MYKRGNTIKKLLFILFISTSLMGCGSSFEKSNVKELDVNDEILAQNKTIEASNEEKNVTGSIEKVSDASKSEEANKSENVVDNSDKNSVAKSDEKQGQKKEDEADKIYSQPISEKDIPQLLSGEWLSEELISNLKEYKTSTLQSKYNKFKYPVEYIKIAIDGGEIFAMGNFYQGAGITNLQKINASENTFKGVWLDQDVYIKILAPKKVLNQYIYDKIEVYVDEEQKGIDSSAKVTFSKFIPSNANADLEAYEAMLIFQGSYKDQNGSIYNFNDESITNLRGDNSVYSIMNTPLEEVYDPTGRVYDVLVITNTTTKQKNYYGFQFRDNKAYIYKTQTDESTGRHLIDNHPFLMLQKI